MCGKKEPINRQAVHNFWLVRKDDDYLRFECDGWLAVSEDNMHTDFKLTPDEMRQLGQWLLDNAPVELIEG